VSAPKIEDHPDHFLVHGKERPYKVFKKGMSKGTVDRFQKMCSGGVVKAANGIAVPDPTGADESAGMSMAVPDYRMGMDYSPTVVDRGAMNWKGAGVDAPGNPTLGSDVRPDSGVMTPDRPRPDTEGGVTQADIDEANRRNAEAKKAAEQPAAEAMPAVPQMHAVGESRLYREGSKEAQDAARAEAKAQAEGERAQAEAYAAHQTATKAAWEAGKKVSDEMHARAKALDDAYARSEVDPEKYWKDGHSKIVAGIGILLSGIGQGVGAAGGNKMSNMAMDVLNKAVEQNINAQEFNIKKAGHAAMSAHQSANDYDVQRQAEMAHAYQMLGLQVQEIAHRTGSQTVIARGDALAAQMKQQAGIHQEQAAQRAAMAKYGNDVNAYQAAAQKAADLRSLPGKTAMALAPYEQSEELLKEMQKADAVGYGRWSGAVEALQSLPIVGNGNMPATQWETKVKLLANELGKISTGGKAGEQEAKHLGELLMRASTTEQRKRVVADVWAYVQGQKKGATRALNTQGYKGTSGVPGQNGQFNPATGALAGQQTGE
jgi:hypothetical protein